MFPLALDLLADRSQLLLRDGRLSFEQVLEQVETGLLPALPCRRLRRIVGSRGIGAAAFMTSAYGQGLGTSKAVGVRRAATYALHRLRPNALRSQIPVPCAPRLRD